MGKLLPVKSSMGNLYLRRLDVINRNNDDLKQKGSTGA
jgi:hypothetical protein